MVNRIVRIVNMPRSFACRESRVIVGYGTDRIQVNPDFDGKAIRTSRAVDLARMR